MIFAKRIYNEEYQTDPFPNMSSLLDKYKKYYRGSEENKKIIENNNEGKTQYNRLSKEYNYNDLSKSINTIQEILQKEIVDYSKAYEKVNETLEINEDPFTKKLRKAKEFKNKVGEGVSKVGKFVSEKSAKVKEQFYGKKPNQGNYGLEMTNIAPQKSNESKKKN
jgi:phage-related protein